MPDFIGKPTFGKHPILCTNLQPFYGSDTVTRAWDRVRSRIRWHPKRLAKMSDVYIGVRIPFELRAQIIALAGSQGISLSEYVRAALTAAVGGNYAPGSDEGYRQAKGMAIQIAMHLITGALLQARDSLPATYEEALVMLNQMPAQ
jgi:hypothetical protein